LTKTIISINILQLALVLHFWSGQGRTAERGLFRRSSFEDIGNSSENTHKHHPMRHHPIAAFVAVLFLISPSAGEVSAQSTDPAVPTGTLSAYPTVVKSGTFPTLTWGVTYPNIVSDLITVTPPGTITPKKSLEMKVRVIGASVKRVWLNSLRQVVASEWVPTEALLSYNGESYSRIWYGTQDNVNPNSIVTTRKVYNGQPIRFGGRYLNWNHSWNTMFTSTSSGGNVRALVNGDRPPTTTPLYQQPTIESFLLPYLDTNGKIKIGPKDVIFLFELTHTDTEDDGFDLQDLVLLCTFTEI